MSRRRFSVLLVALSWLATPARTFAAPCGRPDVDSTFPAHEATGVPPNARLSAHYASPALYDAEPVVLLDAAGEELALSVTFDEAESMLHAVPAAPLRAGFHELVWPGLRSLSGAGVGRGSTTSFFVQADLDRTPPSFEGVRAVDWDLARDRDPCLDRLEDRFVFELTLGEAVDDVNVELLQVLVFQTRAPGDGTASEPRRVALQALPRSGKLEVRRPADAGNTCFAAVVQDLLGNVSNGGEREVCVLTKAPPFFDGCSTSAAARAPQHTAAGWLAAGFVLVSLRRGVRATRRSGH